MSGLFTYRNFSLKDTPPLSGKVAVVTGGQGGVGKEITAQLLLHDIDKVFVIGRNHDKYAQACEEWRHRKGITLGAGDARVDFVQCDLADIPAVKEAAEYIKQRTDRLDLLFCNGGIGISKEYKLSPQKIDVVFAANCVGHHVLTTHLLPLLRQTVSQNKTNDARIVVTSSSLHSFCRELNFDLLASPKPPKNRFVDGIWRYARSKLGNILWTRELNRRLLRDDDPASRRIYVNVFFPGNIVTDQWNVWSEILGSLLGAVMRFVFRVIGQSTEDGAATAMFLGASRSVVDDDIRGRYFIPIATPDATTKIAEDSELARDLWACHGGAIFPGIIDSSTGKSVIAGRKVTSFTTRGEEEGVLDTIKNWSRPTIESSAAAACGANYVSPAGPWDAFTVTDGSIVTSANPASAHVTAEAAVKAFDAL